MDKEQQTRKAYKEGRGRARLHYYRLSTRVLVYVQTIQGEAYDGGPARDRELVCVLHREGYAPGDTHTDMHVFCKLNAL